MVTANSFCVVFLCHNIMCEKFYGIHACTSYTISEHMHCRLSCDLIP